MNRIRIPHYIPVNSLPMWFTRNGSTLAILLILTTCSPNTADPDLFSILQNIQSRTNITYKVVSDKPIQLDVYAPAVMLGEAPWVAPMKNTAPAILYFHGGGWTQGDRSSRLLNLLPYMKKGWVVVNADYRLIGNTDMNGSIADCSAAFEWLLENTKQLGVDPGRIYVSGESSGGHLALLTAIHHGKQVAGIINWYGVSDLPAAIKYWGPSDFTQSITRNALNNSIAIPRQWSPIAIVDETTAPIITIHGDADVNVPFIQSVTLHQRLDSLHISNKLITIKGKKHGNFSASEFRNAFQEIWHFIDR